MRKDGKGENHAEGLFGGNPGGRAQFLVNGVSGNPYGLTQLKPGDAVTIDAAGGGGHGNPLDRDPEKVENDVKDGDGRPEKAREE